MFHRVLGHQGHQRLILARNDRNYLFPIQWTGLKILESPHQRISMKLIFAFLVVFSQAAFGAESIRICNPLDKKESLTLTVDKLKLTRTETVKTDSGYETKNTEAFVLKILSMGEAELYDFEQKIPELPKIVKGTAYFVKEGNIFFVIAHDAEGEKYLFQAQGGWKVLFGSTHSCK
jgi:hypothetical protein